MYLNCISTVNLKVVYRCASLCIAVAVETKEILILMNAIVWDVRTDSCKYEKKDKQFGGPEISFVNFATIHVGDNVAKSTVFLFG